MQRMAVMWAMMFALTAQTTMAADEPTQLEPQVVTPRADSLFEAERRLQRLLKDLPCFGCDVPQPKKGALRQWVELNLLPQDSQPAEFDQQTRAQDQAMHRWDREHWVKNQP